MGSEKKVPKKLCMWELLEEFAIALKLCICETKMCLKIVLFSHFCQSQKVMFNYDTPYILINTNFVNTGPNMPWEYQHYEPLMIHQIMMVNL